MGIDAKDVLVCMWRVFKFVMKTSYKCAQRYPIGSGILLVLFLLYVFLPRVFTILIYASPILVFGAFYLRIYLSSSNRDNVNLISKSEYVAANVSGTRHCNPSLQSYTSRHRNFRENDKLMDEAGKEENGISLSIQTMLIEENAKESSLNRDVSSPNVSAAEKIQELDEQSEKFIGGDVEIEAESMEGEDEDEEETQEDGNKAVEWTEDDQKNLMDLGISELERNTRLELLIARRRASKLSRMQGGKSLIDMDTVPPKQIAPIIISRNDPFSFPNNSYASSPIPGSAPSVLLPGRSPFDLPYDPHEEKPNLTGGSFQHEFTVAQKDMFFSRHESFSLGSSFPLESFEGHGYARFRRYSDKGDYDQLVGNQLSLEDKPMSHFGSASDLVDGGEAPLHEINHLDLENEEDGETNNTLLKTKRQEMNNARGRNLVLTNPYLIEDSDSSPPLSGENRQIFNEPPQCNFPPKHNVINDPIYESTTYANHKARADQLLYGYKRACHTPTYSIASDMQVEVSEVGSPPVTDDETNSPIDGEYNGDVENISLGGDLSGEENELKSRELHEVSEKEIIEEGYSEVNKNSKDPVASPILLEQVSERDLTGESSFSSSKIETLEEGQSHSKDFDHILGDKANQIAESCEEPTSESIEKEQNFTDKSDSHITHEVYSEKAEEPTNLPGMSSTDVNIISNENDSVVNEKEYEEKSWPVEDSKGESQYFGGQEDVVECTKPDGVTSSKVEN